jgi:Helix-turn-helix domain
MAQADLVDRAATDNSPDSLKDWVARVPRKVVLHRMETAECLEDRVFWAIILWSWCGPQVSDRVVIKDRRGYIQKDGAGNPVLARFQDLLDLLGLAPMMKGSLSRAIQRLVAKNSIRYESRILYPVKEPSSPAPNPKSCAYDNFNIAGIVVSTATFPTDEVARTELLKDVSRCSTEWRTELKALKYKHQAAVVQVFSRYGIIIGLEEKKRRGETATAAPPPVEEPAAAATPPPEPPPEPRVPEPTTDEVAQVRNTLAEFGTADFKTAELVITRSRKECPDATAGEVAQKISEMGRGLGRNVRNPIAVLVSSVPAAFRGYRRDVDWEETAKRKVAEQEKLLLDPDCLTVWDASQEYGISTDTIDEWAGSGKLKAVYIGLNKRPGGRYLIQRHDLDEAINKHGGKNE